MLFLSVPMILSAFTHFWNPTGFPALYFDEGIYMRRAMHMLNYQGPQEESTFYDHPYFGQLFLSGVFQIIGCPHLFVSLAGGNLNHMVEMLYFIPRIVMGILAVVDTFLIYRICEYCYNRRVALISSVFFAILSSGIFMGFAIFTKIPAFAMIPVALFIICRQYHDKYTIRSLWLWFIPVILIPLIWPAYSMSTGTLNFFTDGILWQTHRESQPLFNSIYFFFKNDPILLVIGIAGIFFAIIKKNFVPFLWAFPLMIFLYFIGYVSLYHLIPLIPSFCIAAAVLIEWLSNKISRKEIQQIPFLFIITSVICIAGLFSTATLITTNVNLAYFKAAAFVVQYLENINQRELYNNYTKISVIGDAFYLWIPQYIFHLDHDYKIYYDKTPYKTERVLLIVDPGLIMAMSRNDLAAKQIQKIYDAPNKISLASFEQTESKDGKISIYEYKSNDTKIK